MHLKLQDFSVCYGERKILGGVNLEVPEGSWMVCLGPSGSGKSTLADAICGLLPADAVLSGKMEGVASRPARIWQEPRLSLSPLRRIGDQVEDVARAHGSSVAAAACWLEEVGLAGLADRYPWQLSSGQAQRAALARALACGSPLLVADECTSSLDPESEAAVVASLAELWRRHGFSLLWFTHRPAAVAPYASGWCCIERATLRPLAEAPARPSAQSRRSPRHEQLPLLIATGLGHRFGERQVLREVDLHLAAGTTTALLGASGAGKSTLLRLLAGWEKPQAGRVESKASVQLVPPDAATAVAANWTVEEVAGEALTIQGKPRRDREAIVRQWLDRLGLKDMELHRPACRLSGGQRRRLMLARALVAGARVLLLDECLNGLDLPLQRQILATLQALRDELGLALLWVTHDVDYLPEFADVVLRLNEGYLHEAGHAA